MPVRSVTSMDRRTAKRFACWFTGGLIDGALGVGAEPIWQDDDGNDRPPEDVERIQQALTELRRELDRRGHDARAR